jgi:hypothetical protein
VATAHGEVLIERVELVLGVALRDDLRWMSVTNVELQREMKSWTHVEELDVVEEVVVESKVVARDDVDAGVLLDLPVSQTQTLGLLDELVTGELVSPVCLVGLLQVTVRTHAGETEH